MNRVQILSVAAILSLAVASPIFADDDTGFYLGASANRLSADQKNVSDVDFEDSDTALGLKAGYMFTDRFGVEGGYLDLGDYNTRGNEQGIDLNLDAEGFYLVGVLNFSVAENWDIYGKLGGFFLDTNTDLTGFDKSSTELFGGLGVEYDFGKWNIFGEFSKLDTDTNDLTFDIISLGVKYEFGR
jgi:hypothetical protein